VVAVRVLLRLLTVLTAAATAVITLGPREVVVDGRGAVSGWLLFHPTIAGAVERLGGVEPAGNLLLFVPFAVLLAASVPFRALPVVFVLLACTPLAVEWLQRYVPGRVPDGADVLRNTIGLVVGFGAIALLRGLQHLVGLMLPRRPRAVRSA
jgi:hypothetical protein